jgi:hypothetical protein
MSRALSILLGPEVVLAALTAVVFLFCARHNTASDHDVRLLEKLLMVLPLIVVPIAFATILGPGARNWVWLGRVNVATMLCLSLCAYRLVSGFGSGAKGQDVGFMLVIGFGIGLSTIANAICGAMVLREQKPAVASWFQMHPVAGHLLTAVATLPILVVQVIATVAIVAAFALVASAFER